MHSVAKLQRVCFVFLCEMNQRLFQRISFPCSVTRIRSRLLSARRPEWRQSWWEGMRLIQGPAPGTRGAVVLIGSILGFRGLFVCLFFETVSHL